MKALEILKRLDNSDFFDRSKIGLGKEYNLDEAIVELEQTKFAITVLNENLRLNSELLKTRDNEIVSLQSRSCEGCAYDTMQTSESYEWLCKQCFHLPRKSHYKPKE